MPRSTRSEPLLHAGATAILVAAVLWVHAHQGLSRPVPWPDEASFLWQAIAVQRGNTLFAPQLRDTAHVLWMPPGYMWVTGLAFKLLGFSLETARWFSAVCVAAGGATLAVVLRRARHPFAGLLLLAVFLLSPIAVLVANVARMEALLFALACATLLALQRHWIWGGLALATILPLVHPIGALPAAAVAAFVGFGAWRDPGRRRPRAIEWLALALACAAWAAYTAYVAQHFEQFREDMQFQFGLKGHRTGAIGGLLPRLANPALAIASLVVAAAAGAVALGRRLPSALLLVLAVPLVPLGAVAIAARGWPYDFYPALLWLLAAILGSELALDAIDRLPRLAPLRRPATPIALALGLAAIGHVAFRHLPLFLFSVERAQVPTGAAAGVPFVTAEDRRVLAERLREIRGTPERPATVLFLPMGEALLFAELDCDERRLVFRILSHDLADVVILHDSLHLPSDMRKDLRGLAWAWQKIALPIDRWPLVRERDRTEVWRIYDRAAQARPLRAPPP